MGDRRKGDRREGMQYKRVEISLQTFITIVVILVAIFAVIFTWVFVGKAKYDEGFAKGYEEASQTFTSTYSLDDFDEEELDDNERLNNVYDTTSVTANN